MSRPLVWTPEKVSELRELRSRFSIKACAAKLGMTEQTVRSRLSKCGIKRVPDGVEGGMILRIGADDHAQIARAAAVHRMDWSRYARQLLRDAVSVQGSA